ncbi:carbohydrate kinase family protein [Leifsonia kafniensis]|uniref:carbohydrate kinase family protein n=1 Tax=Leifsonia kafniensis TaxID=475957 RepID=UPI0031F12F06
MLAVAGDLLEDVIVWGNGELKHATDNPARIFRTRGGSAANVAAIAAALMPVRFIGKVGTDAAGDSLGASLSELGVDVRLQHGGSTGTVVILVDPSGERTMFPDRAAAAEMDAIDPAWLDGVTWLHLPLYGFETPQTRSALLALTAAAHERGISVSIDVSSVSLLEHLGVDEAPRLIAEINPAVVFANADEAAHLDIAAWPHVAGRTLILKRGAHAVLVQNDTEQFEVAVTPVTDVKDSTGAGDSFAAGYLSQAILGAPIRSCVETGAAVAAQVLKSPGATLQVTPAEAR